MFITHCTKTADDARQSLTVNAMNALYTLGVDAYYGLAYQGTLSFVTQVGQPGTSIVQLVQPGGNISKITVNVTGE